MRNRSGQVALYLVLALVAICVLAVMNVGAFVAVTTKNRMMNAGDAAALAVAKYQGELVNRIGHDNLAHLNAALKGDADLCEEIVMRQLRDSFLGPLEGIRIGNDAAKENGAEKRDRMLAVLKRHVIDVSTHYLNNRDLYPEPYDGAWREYAQRLEMMIGEGIVAGPDNIDFIDAATGHLLINPQFYQAIAGETWCWFHFNAAGVLDSYSSYADWAPLPSADDETRRRRCVNCEIYSLHLDLRTGSAVDLLGMELVKRLTGADEEDIRKSLLFTDRAQKWFFYDTDDYNGWHQWWEIDPLGEWSFPVVGRVKPEYDVRGCAAVCRVEKEMPDVVGFGGADGKTAVWSAAAKPFGTVESVDGSAGVVTANRGFVTPGFSEVRLVPLDSVGGRDLSTADADWLFHVRDHLPEYLKRGVSALAPCRYCNLLRMWERGDFRERGSRWLKDNSSGCTRPSGAGTGRGGAPHGH